MKYPIGIQSFDRIIEDGYVYVDKTDLIYQLAQEGSIYFLSRPRRFGKSLLVSTLEHYFLGHKELFKGLKIDQLEKDWNVYPVFHVDFNGSNFTQAGVLEERLEDYVSGWETRYGLTSEADRLDVGGRFIKVLRAAHEQTGRRAVVLIDEYDKPILDVLDVDTGLEDRHRNVLKAFYSVFKGADAHLQFVLLTGVTKFSQVSVFSGFNQPKDISMDRRYEALCGITQEEIDRYFPAPIAEMADEYGFTPEEMKQRLKLQYDGYHFSERLTDVYNPFSLLNALDSQSVDDYWFRSGTPTYLIRLLTHFNENLNELTGKYYRPEEFIDYKADVEQPLPMIFQSGYLTIKGYDKRFRTYTLSFPNREVEEGFIQFLLPAYSSTSRSDSAFEMVHFVREVESGNISAFMRRLQSFFADTPYELVRDLELHYQNVLFIVFKLLGFYTQAEYHTSNGRIDLVIKTDHYIYVLEFKLEGTAEEALQQINDKQYAQPFASDSRQLYKIGVNFSNETRNIEKWLVEEN